MTLRLLIVDDTSARRAHLEQALLTAQEAGAPALADGAEVIRIADLATLRALDVDTLAGFDAVLVDFVLESAKVPGYQSWERVVVPTPTGATITFTPKTGMTALLLLRSMIESDAYRTSRAAVLDSPIAGWNLADGTARLFSFVDLKDWQSRLFAAAAWHWFGAPCLNAQLSLAQLAAEVGNPGTIQGATPGTPRSQGLAKLGAAVDDGLEGDPVGAYEFLDGEVRPTGLQWYCIYLAHRGKSRFSPEAVREAAYEIAGAHVRTEHLRSSTYQKVMQRLQGQLWDFVGMVQPKPAWEPWVLRDRADPVFEFLDESESFWQAPDVEAAFLAHVEREKADLRW